MIKVFPSEIKGEKVDLVKLAPTMENAKIITDIIIDNREGFSRWLEWAGFVQKPEYEMPVLEGDADSAEWFIKWQNKIVGRIGFVSFSKSSHYGEIGYWLDKKASGHGIMTEAFKMVEKYAFEDWGFHRIELRIDPDNKKSIGVAKRMNFVQEGVRRQEHFINNEYRDSVLFAKLKSEYKNLKK